MHCRKNVLPFFFVLSCLLLNACSSNVRAPVVSPGDTRQKSRVESPAPVFRPVPEKKARVYTVKKGDTLYSIAWNYGHDYREVAEWNNINPPYIIYPGQKIFLFAPPQKKARPLTAGPIVSRKETAPAGTPQEKQESVGKARDRKPADSKKKQGNTDGHLQWSWPARGKLVKSDTPISSKGIDIAGRPGQEVNAAGEGEVVYSGSGLLGYGRLIIIKHNDIYLSAYAHNSELLVSEGDYVKAGQNIAYMGQAGNGRTLLHFEIRKNGKPVNPLEYLPKL